MRAVAGSLLRSNWSVSVVAKLPLGCLTDFGADWWCASEAGAPVWRSEILAPVSMSAVEDRVCGLTQPGVGCRELIK